VVSSGSQAKRAEREAPCANMAQTTIFARIANYEKNWQFIKK